jgi:hypothetical protein
LKINWCKKPIFLVSWSQSLSVSPKMILRWQPLTTKMTNISIEFKSKSWEKRKTINFLIIQLNLDSILKIFWRNTTKFSRQTQFSNCGMNFRNCARFYSKISAKIKGNYRSLHKFNKSCRIIKGNSQKK